jgi:hypothetical protein
MRFPNRALASAHCEANIKAGAWSRRSSAFRALGDRSKIVNPQTKIVEDLFGSGYAGL